MMTPLAEILLAFSRYEDARRNWTKHEISDEILRNFRGILKKAGPVTNVTDLNVPLGPNRHFVIANRFQADIFTIWDQVDYQFLIFESIGVIEYPNLSKTVYHCVTSDVNEADADLMQLLLL